MAGASESALQRWRRWAFANAGVVWFAVTLLATYAPQQLFRFYFNQYLRRHARRLLAVVDPYVTVDIAAHDPPRMQRSDTYEEVKAYLSAACSREARELRAEGAAEGDGLVLSLRNGQEEVADVFGCATVWWSSVAAEQQQEPRGGKGERLCYRLAFHRRHRRLVVEEYLPHVRRHGREVLFNNRRRRLYTNSRIPDYIYYKDIKAWSYIDLEHPTTFETLAIDPAKKREIMADLDAFRDNKDFYRRTGKPWKRGYLLHGPPGTGKSTMVAAMANYLNYDIYDLELTVVRNNTDLRRLFLETTSKSIIVIEDIDCSLDLTGKRSAAAKRRSASSDDEHDRCNLTLSGLLNFIDGLWSGCRGERIIVFTTNHVDKLDTALIRRGRMDMHIEMSYLNFEAFMTLAKNYLGVDAHFLFDNVRELLQEVDITPADVAESLMASKHAGRCTDSCFGHLIEELKKKKEEAKVKAETEAKEKAEAEIEAEAKAMAEAEAKTEVETEV